MVAFNLILPQMCGESYVSFHCVNAESGSYTLNLTFIAEDTFQALRVLQGGLNPFWLKGKIFFPLDLIKFCI